MWFKFNTFFSKMRGSQVISEKLIKNMFRAVFPSFLKTLHTRWQNGNSVLEPHKKLYFSLDKLSF